MIAAHAALIATLTLSAPVELRGGRKVLAPIVDVSPDGVQVGGDEPRVIAWDNIRSVDAEWADRAATYQQVSDDAWRARTRLARGDTVLAAPLFEKLFPQYRDEDGSLALMIAEGVYRCRYGAGDIAGAFEAWLVAANLRERGVEIAGDPPMTPLLDIESSLPPKVPPIFLDGEESRRVVQSASQWLANTGTNAPERLRLIVSAYQRSAAASPDSAPNTATTLPEDPGARLVATIANSLSPDAAIRLSSREELSKFCKGDTVGTWREAWARAAIGRSLILEPTRDERTQGVIELLHLPARFADTQPHLAAVALALASRELARLGDAESAVRLQQELNRLAPDQEAARWLKQQPKDAPKRPTPPDGETS